MVHIVMRYRMRIPLFRIRSQQHSRGTGMQPQNVEWSRWRRFGDGDRDGDGEEDEIVYIGKKLHPLSPLKDLPLSLQ